MISPLRKVSRWVIVTVGVVLLLLVISLGVLQWMLTRAPDYRLDLQREITARTGLVMEFSRISARLRLFGPELVFVGASMHEPDSNLALFTARSGSAGLDIWTSILTGRLVAGRFTLEAPRLAVQRTADGAFEIIGQTPHPGRKLRLDRLPVGRLRVRDAEISYRDLRSGRGPWVVDNIQLEVRRQPGQLSVKGAARLPKVLSDNITFSAEGRGDLDDTDHLAWNVAFKTARVDLAAWVDVMPELKRVVSTGQGPLDVSAGFFGREPQALTLKTDLAELALSVPVWSLPLPAADALDDPDAPRKSVPEHDAPSEVPAIAAAPDEAVQSHRQSLPYRRASIHLQANRTRAGWHLVANDLSLLQPHSKNTRAAMLEVQWEGDAQRMKASGRAQALDIQALWPLLIYLPQKPSNSRLRALQARGMLEDLQFTFDRHADRADEYSVQGRFADIGVNAVGKQPGVTGISGGFSATQASGEARIDTRAVSFDMPTWFRDHLQAQSAQMSVRWALQPDGLQVNAKDIDIKSVDGRARGTVSAFMPTASESSPLLKLDLIGTDLNAVAAPRYLPAGRIPGKAMQWLDQAFKSGRVVEAKAHYDGPTRKFPFRHDEGLFLITAHIEGLSVDYQNGWAPASDITTDVEFRNQGMTAHAHAGNVHDLAFEQVGGAIADFKEAELTLEGRVAGDLGSALAYLQESPIGPGLGEQFMNLRGAGQAHIDVNLRLPLKSVRDYRLAVETHLSGASATTQGFPAQITELAGVLRVREHGLSTSDLKGRLLGAPLIASIRDNSASTAALNITKKSATDPAVMARRETLIVAQGGAQASDLVRLFVPSANFGLAGSAQWRLDGKFTSNAGKLQQVYTLTSDLRGLQSGLPTPFGKSAAEARDLRVDMEINDPSSALLRASAGDVRAIARIARQDDGGWQLDRGGIQVDGRPAAMPDHPGLRIEGTLQTLVLDDWLRLRPANAAATNSPPGRPLSDYLRAANLRVGTFKLFGYSASDVRGIMQATKQGWRVDVASPDITGGITIPYDLNLPSATLSAQLQHLTVGTRETAQGAAAGSPADPRQFPGIQAHIEEFDFGKRHLGAVDVNLTRVPDGLKLAQFRADGASFNAQASGEWLASAAGQTTSIDLTVTSSDVLQTLQALDYGGLVAAKHGELHAVLKWTGGIDERLLERAAGEVSLELQSGQVLSVAPGAGRMLGLLSVAALPRRLALDFSDLTDKGLSFDTIHGDFQLRDGSAYTNNLLLSGPAAEVGMAGRTGLVARDYDQTAIVTGNLGSTLPAAGLLAGGPVVGAALLLFSQVFKDPLKGITRGYYRITGGWDKPVIERIDSAEAKDAPLQPEPEKIAPQKTGPGSEPVAPAKSSPDPQS